jgi:hypothetical protein
MFHGSPGPGRGRPRSQHIGAGRKPVMHGREPQRPVSTHRRCKVADGSDRDSVPVRSPCPAPRRGAACPGLRRSTTDQDAGPRPEAGTQKPCARLPRSAAQRQLLPQRPRGPAIIVARCRVIRVNASLATELTAKCRRRNRLLGEGDYSRRHRSVPGRGPHGAFSIGTANARRPGSSAMANT